MLNKAKIAAVAAAALLLAAMPAFANGFGGNFNLAIVSDNDVKATAVSGDNYQKQENEVEAEVEGGQGSAVVIGGNNGQYMFTGNSYAGAEQTIVANVDACCDRCGECEGECEGECGCRGESTKNLAFIRDNDVRARAVSGDNYQKQENEVEAEVEGGRRGHGHNSHGPTALVVGGNAEQVMDTGDSEAWAAQWIVVNSQGSF